MQMTKSIRLRRAQKAESQRIRDEIDGILRQLGEAYAGFNSATDPELIEAIIYEINALRSRYDYAYRKAKG